MIWVTDILTCKFPVVELEFSMAAVRNLVPPTTVGVIVSVASRTETSATSYRINCGAAVSGVSIGSRTQITLTSTSVKFPVLPN